MSTKTWGGNDSRKARAVCQPLVDQGVPCFRCRKPILPGQVWHADHILEREHGGTDEPGNLWPSHDKCNESAGGKSGSRITNAEKARSSRVQRGNGGTSGAVGSFERSEQPTPAVHSLSLSLPAVLPTVTAEATILSETPDDTDVTEAESGASWLGLPLKPQGLEVARVMQANGEDGHPLYETVGVEIPRRSTKTTAALATLLGRCLNRPGYRVANTAQDGLRARAKLKEVMTTLRAAGFESQGLGLLYFSNGTEHIEFSNGSVWKALPPDPSAFRSDAFDAVLVDEAGELAPEKADALLAGILPTQDTRPDSQTIVAGTPGETRSGLLWDTLEQLRRGEPGVGGVVYEAGDREVFLDQSDPDNPVPNLALLLRVHPGISSGLTTAQKVLSRVSKMGLAKWCREYLCQWPLNAGVTALDVAAWADCKADADPARPENAAVVFDVDKDAGQAALVAAWRDGSGRACFEVLASGPGYDWLPRAAREAQDEHRGPVGYDSIGANIDVADQLSRPPYRVRTSAMTAKDQVGAAARIEKEITRRNVEHYGEDALTRAVEGSGWRPAGNARLFLRVPGSCVLVAAAGALWAFDQRNRSGGRRRIVSSVEVERRRAERVRGAA